MADYKWVFPEAALRKFNEESKTMLRRGEVPEDAPEDIAWLEGKLEFIRSVGQDVSPSHVKDELDERQQRFLLEAFRRMADLLDRMGRTRDSRQLLYPHAFWVQEQIRKAIHSPEPVEPGRLAELMWFVLIYAVTEHRSHHVDDAMGFARQLQQALERIPENGEFLLLYHRVYYAIGRHAQSLPDRKDDSTAEESYSRSLEYCLHYCEAYPEEKPYALYRMSITLLGLARLFIDRGELLRGYRQLSVVKLLLKDTPDILTTSFVDLSLAQVHRQRGELDKAIPLLVNARGVFESMRHHRFYIFCRHELAKALFNSGDLDGALNIFRPASASAFETQAQQRSELRWKINDALLVDRIEFEQECDAAAAAKRPVDPERLLAIRERISQALRDLESDRTAAMVSARGLIVRSEIDLAVGRPENVEAELRPITDGKFGRLDTADTGWAWLVVARARLDRGNIPGAYDAIGRYRNLRIPVENIYFARREEDLSRQITDRAHAGFWLSPDEIFEKTDRHQGRAGYEHRLNRWLWDQCRRRKLSRAEIIETLNLTKYYYEQFQRDYSEPDSDS